MSDIRDKLEELKSIGQEIYNLNKQLKTLRLRKKELEDDVVEYLGSQGRKGLRFENVTFLANEKKTTARKNKAEVLKDTADILIRHGVQGNVSQVIEELEASRKGTPSTVPVLRMKAAGLYE